MLKSKLAIAVLAGALSMSFGLATIQPARADQAAVNRNTSIGIATLVARLFVVANVANKNAIANTVEGTTRDGATVYEDGHVVLPNGYSYYPNNVGQSISCNNGYCSIYADNNGYNNGYNGGYNGGNQYDNGSNRGRRGH